MRDDRSRKVAAAIIKFALNLDKSGDYPPADLLFMEKLSGLIPDAERSRGINKALVNFQRGKIVDELTQMCDDLGLKLWEVHPYGTSQVCSRCGALGRRYRPSREGIKFGPVEKLFACPDCGYRANSDHNASVNLHRVYAKPSWVQSFRDYTKLTKSKQRERRNELESQLQSSLASMHDVGEFTGLPF